MKRVPEFARTFQPVRERFGQSVAAVLVGTLPDCGGLATNIQGDAQIALLGANRLNGYDAREAGLVIEFLIHLMIKVQ